jgi:hypothetical protein
MSAFHTNQAPNLQNLNYRAAANARSIERYKSFLGVIMVALGGCLASCSPSGDFGRPQPSVWNEVILPSAGDFSSYWRGVPTSPFAYTDDEFELRDRAWRFVMPAHERHIFERHIAEMVRTRLVPATWTLEDETSYYPRLIAGFPRSPLSLYRRLSQDIEADQVLIHAFAPAGTRVLAADRVRLRSLLYVKNLQPEEATFAAARVAENRCVIALVKSRIQSRKASYRYALERLVIETPGNEAVGAERALLGFEQRPNPLDALDVGRFDDTACIGEKDEDVPPPAVKMQSKENGTRAVISK